MYSNGGHRDELEPRPVPKPTQFQEISAKPEVPELSVVFESSESNYSKPSNKNLINPPYASSHSTQETYSEWKERQNRSPIHKEPRFYDSREKHYYGSSTYSDGDQKPYSRFSDRESYKSSNDYHKCDCQNVPTVKDIYNMMQIQNDQIKFLLETIQTLLVTVLSNQQTNHTCCCFKNSNCKKNDNLKSSEMSKANDIPEEHQSQNSNDGQKEKPQTTLKKMDKIIPKKNESNKSSKCINKIPVIKSKSKSPEGSKCNSDVNEKNNKKETERTYSIGSDESFDLNENDVQVTETPISPEPSIHIEMKSSSSSEDSSSSDSDKEENDKQIEVGWTMYKNIIGQVNNLLEDTNSEQKSEVAKPVECVKPASTINPKKYEPYTHFMLPENSKIDSSLQMQALAMQYLSPEQAVKFDMSKHFVPKTQCPVKSPNNYSISTLHYMERYHLIGPEKNYNSENLQHKLSADELMKKKKKTSRKCKSPSKILNITELKQQPKLT